MDRREVLCGIGTVVGTGSLAGCGGDGGSSNGDLPNYTVDGEAPARLQVLSVDAPENVTYGEEFSLEATFANVGGESMDRTAAAELAHLSQAGGVQSAELDAEELSSGETRSHSLGPFTAEGAGEYRLEAGQGVDSVHEDVEPLVSVSSKAAETGDGVETPSNLRLTVTDVSYEQALLYADGDRAGLRETLADRVLAVPRIRVENAGSEGQRLGDGAVSISDGSAVTDVDALLLEGPEVNGASVNPGESVEGWAAFAVPTDAVGDLSLGLHLHGRSDPPDVRIDLGDGGGLPEFELAAETVPTEFREGTQAFEFEVENVGDATGTFRGVVEFTFTEEPSVFSGYVTYDEGEWYAFEGEGLSVEIPPGETRSVTRQSSYDGDVTLEYRFRPFDYEWTVEA